MVLLRQRSDLEEYPSKLLGKAIDQLNTLPGVGKRTALRLALFLLRQSKAEVSEFGEAIIKLRTEINYCKQCYNISDEEICGICSNPKRIDEQICVVEDIRDVMAIENTSQFKGKYHVLGGIISPMDGIGPSDLRIDELVQRLERDQVKEVILALSTTMEGDTTNYYLYKQLKDRNVKVSTLAQGIASGDELEFADELTLGRSILNRIPYESTFAK